MPTPLWTILLVAFSTILSAFAAIFMKKSSYIMSRNLKFLLSKTFLLTLFFYGIATILYLFSLKYGELSVLFPIISTTYIWVSILSVKFLGEKMNLLKWLGILGIIIGVTLIGLGA